MITFGFYTEEKLGPNKLSNWSLLKQMGHYGDVLKVLELEYSENFFSLMSVFNGLETCFCTIESLLLVFMKPSLGPQK